MSGNGIHPPLCFPTVHESKRPSPNRSENPYLFVSDLYLFTGGEKDSRNEDSWQKEKRREAQEKICGKICLFCSFLFLTLLKIHASGGENYSSNDTLGLVVHLSALNAVPLESVPVLLANIVGVPLFILAYLCLAFFFFTFPDGLLVPRWSWALISLWIVNTAFFTIQVPLLNINFWPLWLQSLWLFIVFGGSLATQVHRYRRVASPIQRQQIKWLIYGFVPVLLLPICFGLVVALFPVLGSPGSLFGVAVQPLFRFYFLPIPFCIGIALLRYRLWDIDVLINRTLVYGGLSALLLVVYLLLVFAGQYLLSSLFGQNNGVVLVVSTLAVAALFQPLRLRLQSLVDRRFYRRKYDAQKTVKAFSATLRGEVDLEQLRVQLLAVVEETMQPAHLSLWISRPDRKQPQAGSANAADRGNEMLLS